MGKSDLLLAPTLSRKAEKGSIDPYFGARTIEGLDANTLKNVPAAIQNGLRQALQVRGVDLMSRCSGVLSGVHTEADIDAALQAFEGAIQAIRGEGIIWQG